MNLNFRNWAATVALAIGAYGVALPAIGQVQRTTESPFGPAIKVSPAKQEQRTEAPRSSSTAEPQITHKAASKPAAPALPAAAQPPTWTLEPGMPLHLQLRAWAEKAGWQLEWKVPRSWLVPARTAFAGRFDEALEQVVMSLTNEGKPVQLNIWEGNHVAEVLEVTPR